MGNGILDCMYSLSDLHFYLQEEKFEFLELRLFLTNINVNIIIKKLNYIF